MVARANQRHFGGKKSDIVVILVRGLQKCCRVKASQEHGSSFGKKTWLPARRINKQPMLLLKSKINRPGYKFS